MILCVEFIILSFLLVLLGGTLGGDPFRLPSFHLPSERNESKSSIFVPKTTLKYVVAVELVSSG
jgi:hypothetical protein